MLCRIIGNKHNQTNETDNTHKANTNKAFGFNFYNFFKFFNFQIITRPSLQRHAEQLLSLNGELHGRLC